MKNAILDEIKNKAIFAWQSIPDFQECIFLDTPEHTDNIGSMALLVGMLYAVSEIKKAKVLYTASKSNFSLQKIHSFPKQAPIIIRGGNLGNYFWNLPSGAGNKKQYQFIVDTIIAQCHERQIILIPQSVYFNNEQDAQATAKILNAHPNLILMIRDNHSFATACNLFPHCKTILSPDIAFLLYSLIFAAPKKESFEKKILYLKRHDWETPLDVAEKLSGKSLEVSDWIVNRYIKKFSRGNLRLQYFMNIMIESFSQEHKNFFSLKALKEKQLFQENAFKFYINRLALQSLNAGISQLSQYSLVISNRLHGHILSTLLGIPNIILPSPYDKIQNCYDSWTKKIPYCQLMDDVDLSLLYV